MMNIKKGLGVVLAVSLVASAGAAPLATFAWFTTGSQPIYSDQFGTLNQSSTADWLFQVVVDTGNDTTVTDFQNMILNDEPFINTEHASAVGNNTDDDVTFAAWNNTWDSTTGSVGGPGGTSDSVIDEVYAGKQYYFRFFDASTTDAARNAGIIYDPTGTSWRLQAGVSDPTVIFQNISFGAAGVTGSTVSGTADGWGATMAIPEPGTVALFLMGLVTLGVRSSKRRK